MTLSETLTERGSRYGDLMDQARIAQSVKSSFRVKNWGILEADQKEALEMIASKIARILNGDPHYEDSWRDIAGYASLIADRLV